MSKLEYTKCDICGALTDGTYTDKWSSVCLNGAIFFDICPKCIDRLKKFIEDYSPSRNEIDVDV